MEVKEQAEADYSVLSELDNMTTSYKLAGLEPNKDFNIRVQAQNALGSSKYNELPNTIKIPKSMGKIK